MNVFLSYLWRMCLALTLLTVFNAWWPVQPILAQSGSGITSPAPGSSVGGAVSIVGTAAIDSFQRYELYYKQEPNGDDAYIYFDGDTRSVTNGQLGVWQTNDLAPGTYSIRLRVVKADGNYSEHFAPNLSVNLQPPTATATITATVDPSGEPSPTPIPIDTPTPVPQPTPAVVEVQQPNIGGGNTSAQDTQAQVVVEPSPTSSLVALGQDTAATESAQNTDTGEQSTLASNFTQELGAAVAIDRLRDRFMTGVRYSAGIFLIVFAIFAGKRLLEWTISRAG